MYLTQWFYMIKLMPLMFGVNISTFKILSYVLMKTKWMLRSKSFKENRHQVR